MENPLELITTTTTTAAAATLIKPPSTFTTIIILITISYTLRLLLHLFHNRHRVPILTFKPTAAAVKPLFCTICLYDVAAGDRYRKLPKCNHSFHVDCIDAWFQSKSTCPLCRDQLSDQQLPPRPKNNVNRTFLSSFITISKNVIRNMGNPLCHI